MENKTTDKKINLPTTLVTLVDLGKVQRELEALENYLEQAAARGSGESMALPKTTKTIENIARDNKLQLLDKNDRELLVKFLDTIRQKAPLIHISFSSEPSAVFLKRIIEWFRSEINPYVLLQVGLQPNIAAGCVLRTPNKYFDFSMRRHLLANQKQLVESIKGSSK